jgi:hypothetical protein
MRWMSSICLVILLAIVSLMVLIRFFPVVALGWEDEVVELAFAWMIFLGSAAVWRSHEHIVIDFVPQALAGSRAGRVLEIVVGVLVLAFLGVHWYGWRLTLQAQGNTRPCWSCPSHFGIQRFRCQARDDRVHGRSYVETIGCPVETETRVADEPAATAAPEHRRGRRHRNRSSVSYKAENGITGHRSSVPATSESVTPGQEKEF